MSLFSVPSDQTAAGLMLSLELSPETDRSGGRVYRPSSIDPGAARHLRDFAGRRAVVRRRSSSGVKHTDSSWNRWRGT